MLKNNSCSGGIINVQDKAISLSMVKNSAFFLFFFNLLFVCAHAQNVAVNSSGAAAAATNMFEVTQSSTAANMVALYAIHNGANAVGQTGYGFQAIKTGATGINVAGYFSASGGGSNYSIIVPSGGGNVGFGLTAPAYSLHLSSANAWSANFSSTAAANGGIYVNAASGFNANIGLQENAVDKWYLGNRASNDRFSFIDGGGATEVVTILQGGNTGIGTITPGQKLTVSPNSSMTFTLGGLPNPAFATGAYGANPSDGIGLFAHDITSGYVGWVGALRTGNENCGGWGCKTLRLQVPDGSGNVLNALNILGGSGNVGIGTTAPTTLLTVSVTASTDGITLDGTTHPQLLFKTSGTTRAQIGLPTAAGGYDAAATLGDIVFRTSGGKMFFGTNGGVGTAALSIMGANGNVGIGVTAPGAKLEVGGQVKITGGTPGLNKVLTSDATGLASWVDPTTLVVGSEWTDGGAYLYPADGAAERVSIGTTSGTAPFVGTAHNLLVYSDANYGSEATVKVWNDENANSQTATALDLQFANCTAVGADDKFVRFLRALGTEVGSISGEVTYSTFTGAHVGQSDEDGHTWRPGMIVSACGSPNNPTMSKAWTKIRLATSANDKAAIGAFTNLEFPHRLADLDTTRPAYYYNALGEGMILVTDLGGDIAIGDYITTSNRPGYGMKQADDLLHNYTVAKATDSVKWSEVQVDPQLGFKWKLLACTYHGG